jgi:His-Xaa-Ser system protein HxsD
MKPRVVTGQNAVVLDLDEKLFPREAVVAAAYVFVDRCYVRLERAPKKHVRVRLKGKRKLARTRLENLAEEFENELLHQLIRHQVAGKTEQLREILVGRALLSAAGAEPQAEQPEAVEEDLDYLDDPLGIAVPWEEKYGDEKEDK